MIESIQHVSPIEALPSSSGPAAATGDAFASALRSAIHNVEAQGRESSGLAQRFLAGEPVDLHTVALASQKASLQFDYFLQVRNKVVNAYQEVMRMQL